MDLETRFHSEMLNDFDDLLVYGDSLGEIKENVDNFLGFASNKNLILKTSKFAISEEVEFDSSVVSADTVIEN